MTESCGRGCISTPFLAELAGWKLSRRDSSARVQRAARWTRDWIKPAISSLRRWTRRYLSQRDKFHLACRIDRQFESHSLDQMSG